MTGRKQVRRVRAAVVLSALLAVAGGTFLGLRYGQAQNVPFRPHAVYAAFEENDSRLVVGVVLKAGQEKLTATKLQVDVTETGGKTILGQASQSLTDGKDFDTYRFDFPIKKSQAKELSISCLVGNKQYV